MFAAVPYQNTVLNIKRNSVHNKLNFSLLKPHLLCELGVLFEIINQIGGEVQI